MIIFAAYFPVKFSLCMAPRLPYFIISFFLSASVYAQPCTGAIATYPYTEDFEASAGNWIPGGTASDWAWGTPAKPVITGAGQGAKCWIIGGLTNSFYNNGENSFLQSPCFDFTALLNPRISFKIFWETEKKFDGAALQYSIDGGNTWTLVGAANSNSNCNVVNWYNSPNITYLSGLPGWSGNIQTNTCGPGNGSGGWLTAAHDLTFLAGLPNVSFRFIFGAGTICNSFDGFAVDDINIAETPPNSADFSFACKPARTVDFISNSGCATSYSWNFGDIASGAANMSGLPNPTHIFSSAGSYAVSLTTTFATGTPFTLSKNVTVLDVTANIDQAVSCNGSQNAVLSAAASGSTLPYNYVWNTNPAQTSAVISGVAAGNYTVTVFSGIACPASAMVIVTEPAALQISAVPSSQKCSVNNGGIISNVTGGTAPYTYLWSTGSTSSDLTNLAAGIYSLQVTDDKGCIANAPNLIVAHDQVALNISLGADAIICPGDKLILSAGNFASYLWQDNSTAQTFTVTASGTYTVKVTDANGCTGTGSVNVIVDCSDIYFPVAFTPNGDNKNDLFGPAGTNLSAVKNYHLDIYNRYGENVFHSIDPFYKWKGTIKAAETGNAAFVWTASYSINGKMHFKNGSLLLIR